MLHAMEGDGLSMPSLDEGLLKSKVPAGHFRAKGTFHISALRNQST